MKYCLLLVVALASCVHPCRDRLDRETSKRLLIQATEASKLAEECVAYAHIMESEYQKLLTEYRREIEMRDHVINELENAVSRDNR